MRVFTCGSQIEDAMTCIYEAWSWALKNGHENVKLEREPIQQLSLFYEYVHVDGDSRKSEKVVRSIQKKISMEAYIAVYYGVIYKEDVLDDIYRFLRIGFKAGACVSKMLAEPAVLKMMEVRRNVGNEIHAFREFARFDSLPGEVLVCHLEPQSDVIYLVGNHFEDRMPSCNWMIIDDQRKTAVIHPADGTTYMKVLTDEELDRLKQSEEISDEYRELWSTFFRAIAIEQRKNPKCQRNMFPVWRRKHATEFRDMER